MDYIYALIDPRDNAVRYVGKTCRPERRYNDHLTEKYNFHRIHWIQSLLAIGLKPKMTIIEEVPAGANWEDREIFWIKHYRDLGCNLTNGTDGGDHPPSGKGEKRPKSESWYRNITIANQRPRTARQDEASQKLKLVNIGRKHSAETKAKWSEGRKGKKIHDDKFKKRLGEQAKRQHKDPEFVKKMIDGIRKYWDDPARSAKSRLAVIESNKRRRKH